MSEATMRVVVSVRTEAAVKAEALREAADALYGDAGPADPLSTATWLRDRAAALVAAHAPLGVRSGSSDERGQG